MLRTLSASTKRGMFVAAAAVGVWCVLPAMPIQTSEAPRKGAGMVVIQTYHIDVPREASVDLRERIAATRWPQSDAVQFATIRGGEGKLEEESDKTVRPFVERGRDKAAVERLLAESFVAASAADVQFMVKDSKK
jgi:hypothetical protein